MPCLQAKEQPTRLIDGSGKQHQPRWAYSVQQAYQRYRFAIHTLLCVDQGVQSLMA